MAGISPTNNVPLKSDVTDGSGRVAPGVVYEVDGDPGKLCFTSRQDGEEYGVNHTVAVESCALVDSDAYPFARRVSIQGNLAVTTADDKIYDLKDPDSVAELQADLSLLYPDLLSVEISGAAVKFRTNPNTVAGPVGFDPVQERCAFFPRVLAGAYDIQLEVDYVDGAIVPLFGLDAAARLAAIQAAYPVLSVRGFNAVDHPTHGLIWELVYLSDSESDVITKGFAKQAPTTTVVINSVDTGNDTATATLTISNPDAVPVFVGAFALGDQAANSGAAAVAGSFIADFSGAAIPIEVGTVVTIGLYPTIELQPNAVNYSQEAITA